ncbi:MAG TPA: hypothetical protein PJ987_09580 [Bacteroidia bacterium]|nr:hypothetical protein [Bacteroidia bacterium]HMY42170.1 hypothetical protein [Chitinophagales bacterium]
MEVLKNFFEEQGFNVHLFEQENQQCAEVEKWTDGGVDMIFVLMPFTSEKFIERVNNFDIDEEIDLHRQDPLYKSNFTISESLKDFKNFHGDLKQVVKKLQKAKL